MQHSKNIVKPKKLLSEICQQSSGNVQVVSSKILGQLVTSEPELAFSIVLSSLPTDQYEPILQSFIYLRDIFVNIVTVVLRDSIKSIRKYGVENLVHKYLSNKWFPVDHFQVQHIFIAPNPRNHDDTELSLEVHTPKNLLGKRLDSFKEPISSDIRIDRYSLDPKILLPSLLLPSSKKSDSKSILNNMQRLLQENGFSTLTPGNIFRNIETMDVFYLSCAKKQHFFCLLLLRKHLENFRLPL